MTIRTRLLSLAGLPTTPMTMRTRIVFLIVLGTASVLISGPLGIAGPMLILAPKWHAA
jgi:hypothetical protein